MLRIFPLLILMPGGAFAHVGHIGEVAGHDHITIGVAVGAIGLAGLLGLLRGRAPEAEPEDEIQDEDLQEA